MPPADYGDDGPSRAAFPSLGKSYVDPVFGTTVRRLTDEYPRASDSDLYAKNGYWNADSTLVWHRAGASDYRIIRAVDGRGGKKAGDVVRMNVPGDADGSFAPDDPDVWYYFSGAALVQYSVSADTSSVVHTFSAPLGGLGGSTDWIDASGRYMLLMIGRALNVYDRQTDTLYSGAIHATLGEGWAGISPDGRYVVVAGDQHYSYAIDHDRRALSTKAVMFWSLCGDHGDLVSSPTTGKTYMVTFECDSEAAVYAVDVSLPQSTRNLDQQRAQNRKLFETDWTDGGHFSGVSRGPMRDWVFTSIESDEDTFDADPAAIWNRPYMQEIVMANVVTGEVRRLAHHRSRSVDLYYRAQPRLSVSWDGSRVMWASNFGVDTMTEYCDIYAMDVPLRREDRALSGDAR
jgi:hypothetical protein